MLHDKKPAWTNLFALENFLEFAFYPLNRDVGHGYPRVAVRLWGLAAVRPD